ncbi:MAG: HigA family addiction module antitoxin [Acidimicrobiia bacterium]
MNRIPTHRQPTHPGEMLLEEFLKPLCLTQRELADAIGVPYQRVNEIVNQRRGITPSTALRLARYFGTSSGFWMNGQTRWDLYQTQLTEGDEVRRIRRHPRAASGREASA